ncbi:hypothetical protein BT93_L0816 [Corymbia citriodora subsp. variegata]|uniref:non-specific serine/threonine protein kinase n=1 Tax=Corymbia citriodora subsp. variegata TaxID=360336 RepID=A0A8T0CP29_CORYI|nr:hypothetical protein BT93_L0816 [Corymbia citriodora subsp. variegata]
MLGGPLEDPTDAVGRATYYQPMQLWDSSTGNVADFVSRFTFTINSHRNHSRAEGIVFFLAPNGSQIPEHSEGPFLGLTNSNPHSTNSGAFVAVEFDTSYENSTNAWDLLCDHVGIDVNNLTSVNATCVSWMDHSIFHGHNARAMSLSVLFGDNADNSTSLYYQPVNLTEYLPEWVVFGFAASTGQFIEPHTIFTWDFKSGLHIIDAPTCGVTREKRRESWSRAVIIGLISLVLLILVAGFGWYYYTLKRNRNGQSNEEDFRGIGEGLEQPKGPKKYSYKVLAVATNNFSNTRLLGEGGFGGVYEGHLADANSHVAIKKITPESNQGVKEYATEVKTIRHIRHKNLVELFGWCHERDKFLLVMNKVLLTWERRYNIAQGIALGLKYLHEELKQCIVHRDIKSSNILLDAHFEAKLGNFSLARMVDHAKGSQTTELAGTMGYLAPKCIYTGKAKIVCGRKTINPRASEDQVQLVEWVRDPTGGVGPGALWNRKAVKCRRSEVRRKFDTRQMECLMTIGLWCTHPDPKERPPISKAVAFLNFDASPPILPPKLPILTYTVAPSLMPESSHISSSNSSNSEPPSADRSEPCAFTNSS